MQQTSENIAFDGNRLSLSWYAHQYQDDQIRAILIKDLDCFSGPQHARYAAKVCIDANPETPLLLSSSSLTDR